MSADWEIEGFLEDREGELQIDGVPATELAAQHGTPVFVFSANRINQNIKRLLKIQSVIDCRLKVCYAAKAMSDASLLAVVRESGVDIEVNSGGELEMALDAGFVGNQIIFNGTSKTHEEIESAVQADIYAIQADSIFELRLIERVAADLNRCANVSLRLVPDVDSKTHRGLQTALLTSKFGMMPDEAIEALREWPENHENVNIHGIHIHIGSQNPSSDSYAEAMSTLFADLLRIRRETGRRMNHVNIGGGFPVNYLRDASHAAMINEDQRALLSSDYEPADAVGRGWQKMKKMAIDAGAEDLLEDLELLIEPGRYVVGNAAVCLTTVRNMKTRPIKQGSETTDQGSEASGEHNSKPITQNPKLSHDTWLLTDAGFNILLSMETYKWYYHLIHATRTNEHHDFPYKVAGPLCDGGDVYFDIEGHQRLPDYRLLPKNIAPGELLALLNTGAYSVSQMFPYNGRELPKVVIVKNEPS